MDKTELRQKLLRDRRALTPSVRSGASKQILQHVIKHPAWLKAKRIGCYVSLPDEVFTHDLFNYARALGKEMAAPIIHPVEHRLFFCPVEDFSHLKPGLLGILEPELENPWPAGSIDLLIIPGVGFDWQGQRLGFGRGFYDSYLVKSPAYRMALAFEMQIVNALPTATHDIPMHVIITEKQMIQAMM